MKAIIMFDGNGMDTDNVEQIAMVITNNEGTTRIKINIENDSKTGNPYLYINGDNVLHVIPYATNAIHIGMER